jgi:glycosyltransferase involved in cell wall biosynthesis
MGTSSPSPMKRAGRDDTARRVRMALHAIRDRRRAASASTGPRPGPVAIVSTFPPRRDGIATYAAQYAAAIQPAPLRIGDEASRADVNIRFGLLRTPWQILHHTSPITAVHVMWHPVFYVPPARPMRAAVYLLWSVLGFRRRLRVVVHEPEPSLAGIQHWCQRWFWHSVSEVLFHSRAEREVFVRTVGEPDSPRLALIDHHAAFRAASHATHEEAQARLGISAGTRVALCIGFFGTHKGFDRAIRAFAQADLGSGAHLYIVGSVLQTSPTLDRYVAELRSQASPPANVTLLERYVTDEEFDLWLLASDVVVLPYRAISSSSVAARARILGRPVIATRAGGLAEQLHDGTVLVDDDDELAEALKGHFVTDDADALSRGRSPDCQR